MGQSFTKTKVPQDILAECSRLSKQPFGRPLAQQFIDALHNGKGFATCHPGYCGWIAGYSPQRDQFLFTRSWEGGLGVEMEEAIDLVWKGSEKEQLIEWLANQSDYTMSGADDNSIINPSHGWINNQTLSEKRIREFLQEVEEGKRFYNPFSTLPPRKDEDSTKE